MPPASILPATVALFGPTNAHILAESLLGNDVEPAFARVTTLAGAEQRVLVQVTQLDIWKSASMPVLLLAFVDPHDIPTISTGNSVVARAISVLLIVFLRGNLRKTSV